MSYSLNAQGTIEEVSEKLVEQINNQPEEQIGPAECAVNITGSIIEDFFQELLGEELTDTTNLSVSVSGHKQTPGTAKGYFNIRIDILD